MIDSIATRYKKLPSEILSEGDTFDMLVMDVAVTYDQYIRNKKDKKPQPGHMYDPEQLKELGRKYYNIE